MSITKFDNNLSMDGVATIPTPQTSVRTLTDNSMENKPMNAQVISDGTTDRILIGYQDNGFGDGDIGIKVSQTGNDVKTCTDDKLVMSSAFNTLKIVQSGLVTFTLPGGTPGTSWIDIPHNLGFVPAYFAYVDIGGQYQQTPRIIVNTTSSASAIDILVTSFSDASKLRILYTSWLPHTGTFNIKYYLFRETAS